MFFYWLTNKKSYLRHLWPSPWCCGTHFGNQRTKTSIFVQVCHSHYSLFYYCSLILTDQSVFGLIRIWAEIAKDMFLRIKQLVKAISINDKLFWSPWGNHCWTAAHIRWRYYRVLVSCLRKLWRARSSWTTALPAEQLPPQKWILCS